MATVATQLPAGTFVADPIHSTFQLGIKHMKVSTFRATLHDAEAQLVAGESTLSLAGAARVESISITHPPEFRDHVVYGADFFDARNHPEIAFRTTRMEIAEDGAVAAEAELTIRGVSRPIVVGGTHQPPVEDPMGSLRTALELTATVDRRDWGLDWQMPLPKGGDALAWEVELSVHLELVEQS